MNISVFGLGYVGCVSAACLARMGHKVIGVDVNEAKVNSVLRASSPIIETKVESILSKVVGQKMLSATTDHSKAIMESDLSIVCVGTPGHENGSLDLSYVKNVCRIIGEELSRKDTYHTVVIRSTLLPGSAEKTVIPILEETSMKKAGVDFGVCVNPEFLRESTAVNDFYNPSFTLIGGYDEKSAAIVEEIYQDIDAPVVKTDLKTAEMVKYVNNSFHALKVCFANEIGNICKKLALDSHEVMNIFCMDSKLNLSSYYLKPGFAFGGSCLPKDVRALVYKGFREDLSLPLLQAIMPSNQDQIENGVKMIMKTGKKKIGILGLSFKAGTDDLRESPLVNLVETLIGKGLSLKIYDSNVSLAKIMGANKEYIEKTIPHISALLTSELDAVLSNSEVIVLGNKDPNFLPALEKVRKDQILIDLVRICEGINDFGDNYQGICW